MPQPVFTFTIDNETAYGDYECTAINMYGKATKHIRLEEGFRPGALRDVRASFNLEFHNSYLVTVIKI